MVDGLEIVGGHPEACNEVSLVKMLLTKMFIAPEKCQHIAGKQLGPGESVRLDRVSQCLSMNYVFQQMSVFQISLRHEIFVVHSNSDS